MEHLAPLATMATINGDNGCSIVANGDSVSGANGDHNRHWRQCTMATSIGANGDRHWRPLAPFKWRHLIHSMAILSSQSPFRVSGSFGDPMAPIDPVAPLTTMATMAIHLRQWYNGANSDDGDPLVPMAPMTSMTSMATMVQNLIMTAALATMVPMAPMAIVIAIGTTHRIAIRANGTAIVAIGVIGAIGAIGAIITNGSP